jgi:hypothetical protein
MYKDRLAGLAATTPNSLALACYFSADILGWAHALAATATSGFTLIQLFFWEALLICKGRPIGLAIKAPNSFDLAYHFSENCCQWFRMGLHISCCLCQWPHFGLLFFWDVPPIIL